jgi:ATP-binding cassette subfamily B (MDR/TAP) protein 1
VFYFGTLIYKHRGYTAEQIFSASNVLLMASAATGMSAANVPSVAKAAISASKVFQVIDDKSTLDAREGAKAKVQSVDKGAISFEKVDFKYPSRDNKILNGLNLKIPA